MSNISVQQQAAIDAAGINQHIIVEASAGSGKTFLIFEMLKAFKEPSLVLSFNTAIKNENSSKIKDLKLKHVDVYTFHGFGISTIPKPRRVSPYKVANFVERLDFSREDKGSLIWLLTELRGKGLFETDYKSVRRELKHPTFLKSPATNWVKHSKFISAVLTELDELDTSGSCLEIDFDDMCRMPVKHGLINESNTKHLKSKKSYSRLYVDEAQDLSDIQIQIIADIIKVNPDIKLVVVGDRKQSIYGFRGAHNSFDKIHNLLNSPPILPLDTTYRCKSNIVDYVNRKVPASHMIPFSPGGEVERVYGVKGDKYAVEEWKEMDVDMVIATKNSTLISIWISLLECDRIGYFKGNNIGNALKSIAKTYNSSDWSKFKQWLRHMASNGTKKLNKMTEHMDLAGALIEFITRLRISAFHELSEKLDILINQKEGDILLETVHSAKGREADTVAFIWDFWTKEQKMECLYVALTRAKNKLIPVIIPDEAKSK